MARHVRIPEVAVHALLKYLAQQPWHAVQEFMVAAGTWPVREDDPVVVAEPAPIAVPAAVSANGDAPPVQEPGA
jgi:hypothetical protein